MKKIICLGLIGLFFSFTLQAKKSDLPSAQQKVQFKDYYESGRYFEEIDHKLRAAKDYLDRQLQTPRPNRLAIILDIDETALSNYNDLERLFFTHNTAALTGAHMLGNANPIVPVLALYQHALAQQVAVFFISERPNTFEITAATVKNLRTAGFTQWEGLILKPIDKETLSVAEFKTNARRQIAAQGFDIILNVGDQEADLQPGYAEIKVKIPNPFYQLS